MWHASSPPHILSASLRVSLSFSYDLYTLYTPLGVSETANAWSFPRMVAQLALVWP